MKAALLAPMLGISTAFLWGVMDFLGAKAAKEINPVLATFFIQLIGLAVFAVLYVLFLRNEATLNMAGFLYAAAAGLFMTFGLTLFYQGLKIGPVSLVSPISGAYPLVTTAITVFAFGATVSAWQLTGIAMIVVGVSAAAGLFSPGEKKLTKGVVYGLCGFVLFGFAFAALAQSVEILDWQLATIIQLIFSVLGFVPLLFFVKRSAWLPARELHKIARNKNVLCASLLQLVGFITLNVGLAVTVNSGAVLTAIAATYPVLTALLALKYFQETVSPLALGGVAISICGVVVLSL